MANEDPLDLSRPVFTEDTSTATLRKCRKLILQYHELGMLPQETAGRLEYEIKLLEGK